MPNSLQYMVMGDSDIGVTLAGYLQFLAKPFQLIGRKYGLTPNYSFESFHSTAKLTIKPLSHSNLSLVGCAIFCVKTYDLLGAIERHISYLTKEIPIIVVCPASFVDSIGNLSRKYSDYFWRVGYVSFDTMHSTNGVFKQIIPGQLLWGNLPNVKVNHSEITPIEKELLHPENKFFSWHKKIINEIRRKWLFDLVINSLCCALDLPKLIHLLDDVKHLQSITEQGYQLGIELWGPWEQSFDKMFTDLISFISLHSQKDNTMLRSLKIGERTENSYYAKLAVGRRNMDKLVSLSEKIEQKELIIQRERREKSRR